MRRSLLYVGLATLLVVPAIPAQAFAQDIPASRLVRAPEPLQTLSPVVMDKALAGVGKSSSTVTREIAGQTYMSLWLEGVANEADLKSLGVIIATRFPNGVMTAEVPVATYRDVAALPGMTRITAVHMARKCLNYSTPTTQAEPNYWTSSPPNFSGQTGAGVVVGDVNNGIDYKHLDFKNPDGTSRILFLWDQIDTTTPHPSGYAYGREFTNADLNANLATVRDGADGHGSHCMGIAAGDGSATGNGYPGDVFIGMAPRADMIIVVSDCTDADIADGVNYIFTKATSLGKNAVVNLSLGSSWGAHMGNEAFDTSLNSLTAAGKIIVASAGNDGGQALHALQMVPIAGGNQTVTFSVPSYTANPGTSNDFVQVDAYYDATASMEVAITSPHGYSNVAAVIKGGTGSSSGADGHVWVENGYTASPSGLQNIFIQIYDGVATSIPHEGTWTITLTPISGTNPQLDLWLPFEQLGALDIQPLFTSDVDEHDTISSPASAPNIIAVGAITDKNRWLSINGHTYVFTDTTATGALTLWSSVGPLRDGTQKPDIATFGGGVMSTLSSAVNTATYATDIHPDGKHIIMSGTSMASPHVAGGVALILAETPGLTPVQVKTRLANDALVDGQTGSVWNYQYGNGKLQMLRPDPATVDDSDANSEINSPESAMADAPLGPGEVLGVYPNPAYAGAAGILYRVPRASAVDVSIYDVTGKQVKKIEAGVFPDGVRTVNWDGRDEGGKPSSTGIYLVRLMTGSGIHQTKRLVLFR